MGNQKEKKGHKWATLKETLKREGRVLLTAIAVYAGAASFFEIAQRFWNIEVGDWWLVSLVASLFALPAVSKKVRRSKEPTLIKLAVAYKEGFLALQSMMPDFSSWMTKMRGFWRNITKKL